VPLLSLLACAMLLAAACGEQEIEATPPDPPPAAKAAGDPWSASELAVLESLAIGSLREAPPQPSNRVADDRAAAELGHRLFFDPRLSRDGSVACATCHVPELLFTDGRATSRGLADTSRNAPTLVGAAHSPWMFWDGRRDSLWAQALGPLEAGVEMGSTRLAVVRYVTTEPTLAALYARVFGSADGFRDARRFPERAGPFGEPEEREAWHRMAAVDRRAVDQAFANVGKAIAAYERLLMPGPSRFDRYVSGLRGGGPAGAEATLSEEEIQGLRLFVDAERSLCLRCHNGPLLTNQSFHHVGTASGSGGLPDFGRFLGIQAVLVDPFNCRGAFSDAKPNQCQELRFLDKAHVSGEMGKFKTPTLRGLPRTGPYMHDGRFATLEEVIEHYRSPPAGNASPELTPLEIDDEESRALVAFLATLDGDVELDRLWLRDPRAPLP
jgi:cytochrome c peroxidase